MDSSSVATSRRAAHLHARTVAAGPPRSARWALPGAGLCALGAAVALPLLRPAAVVLAGLAVLLLAVHRGDRRAAWRYAPEPVAPARFLPPLRPVERPPVAEPTVPAEPVALQVAAVHIPTQAVPLPGVPEQRVVVGARRDGRQPVPVRTGRSPAPRRRA